MTAPDSSRLYGALYDEYLSTDECEAAEETFKRMQPPKDATFPYVAFVEIYEHTLLPPGDFGEDRSRVSVMRLGSRLWSATIRADGEDWSDPQPVDLVKSSMHEPTSSGL